MSEKISNLSECAVRFTDGTIDVEESLLAFQTQLEELSLKEEGSLDAISQAVNAVFDLHLGKVLPMPAVCAIAAQRMGVTPSEYTETNKAIGLWIRNNAAFKVAKGKGGGVHRVCDAAPKAE